jgi:transposase
MIAFPSGVRVWLATGHTDMRKGFGSLAVLVQETLKRNPHAGDLYVFRGRQGDLLKIIWHDGQGACLFTKRLERGRFLWPSIADGVVTISSADSRPGDDYGSGELRRGDAGHYQELRRPPRKISRKRELTVGAASAFAALEDTRAKGTQSRAATVSAAIIIQASLTARTNAAFSTNG